MYLAKLDTKDIKVLWQYQLGEDSLKTIIRPFPHSAYLLNDNFFYMVSSFSIESLLNPGLFEDSGSIMSIQMKTGGINWV
jgi:hypothetical protein